MSQVVIVISAMLLADLREAPYTVSGAAEIVEICARHGATISAASATIDPEQASAGYLTIYLDGDAAALAEDLRTIDTVREAFVKPGVELP